MERQHRRVGVATLRGIAVVLAALLAVLVLLVLAGLPGGSTSGSGTGDVRRGATVP